MNKDNARDFSAAPGAEIVSDSRCFVCGMGNPGGLRVRFFRSGEYGAHATWTPEQPFMGYDGLLHGGVSAALLDEIMIKALLARGRLVMTARMSVAYHKPAPMTGTIQLAARLVREKGRIFETEGELTDQDGTVLVSATGTYVEISGARREELMKSLGALAGP